MSQNAELRELVRRRYAEAASAIAGGVGDAELPAGEACRGSTPADLGDGSPAAAAAGPAVPVFGSGLYDSATAADLPAEAVAASLGCGNPTAVAGLRPGERVLDLGSGGGIDVLVSARRVGPSGFVYGVDMTEEMLMLARANAVKAGVANVAFLKGMIEDVPLADGAVDVVISNCVVNLSTDKPAVLAEMFRVLAPGGRIGVADVVAEDGLSLVERAERGSHVGCLAGALSRAEYLAGLAAAGFAGATVEFTHEVVEGMHGAIVRAFKPAGDGCGADRVGAPPG
ncbi:MAG: methyltransferase domain-containing protein [Bifidobacteriaceae bacterium]|nr:methyltransferase domain-containing protein [Bifidobacteriaceae bacterium]